MALSPPPQVQAVVPVRPQAVDDAGLGQRQDIALGVNGVGVGAGLVGHGGQLQGLGRHGGDGGPVHGRAQGVVAGSAGQDALGNGQIQIVLGPGSAGTLCLLGIAGGQGEGLLFKKGEIIRKIKQEDMVAVLKQEILEMVKEERK